VLPHADVAGKAHSHVGSEYMHHFREAQMIGGKKVKSVRLDDEWETFTVRFRSHIPEYHNSSEMTLLITDTIIRHVHKDNEGYKMLWAA